MFFGYSKFVFKVLIHLNQCKMSHYYQNYRYETIQLLLCLNLYYLYYKKELNLGLHQILYF